MTYFSRMSNRENENSIHFTIFVFCELPMYFCFIFCIFRIVFDNDQGFRNLIVGIKIGCIRVICIRVIYSFKLRFDWEV